LIFFVLALLVLFIAVLTTIFTLEQLMGGKKGLIAAYLILYSLSLYFACRSIYFYSMKKSFVVGAH